MTRSSQHKSAKSITAREVRWLQHIERHGPQSSRYLYELTRVTHRCKDTALRALQKLRAGGFLCLPPQQRQTAKADFNPYIYDTTRIARDHLCNLSLDEPTVRPRGHWWHSYSVSCVTSSIEIAATRDGVRYIPAHTILAIKDSSLAIPIGRERLIPDQLFALDYGGSFRAFALEVDRGTEPKISAARRKSYVASIERYRRILETKRYKDHYGLKANLLVLWVFTSRRNEKRFLELVGRHGGEAAKSILMATVKSGGVTGPVTEPMIDLFQTSWRRADGVEIMICAA